MSLYRQGCQKVIQGGFASIFIYEVMRTICRRMPQSQQHRFYVVNGDLKNGKGFWQQPSEISYDSIAETSLLFAVAVSLLVIASLRGVIAQPQKEGITTNFIFLIDVSGSMLFDSTTPVTTAEGERITLFEALRKALIEIVKDERLIAPSSRVEFITFGTRVEEKSSWVKRLDTNTDKRI